MSNLLRKFLEQKKRREDLKAPINQIETKIKLDYEVSKNYIDLLSLKNRIDKTKAAIEKIERLQKKGSMEFDKMDTILIINSKQYDISFQFRKEDSEELFNKSLKDLKKIMSRRNKFLLKRYSSALNKLEQEFEEKLIK